MNGLKWIVNNQMRFKMDEDVEKSDSTNKPYFIDENVSRELNELIGNELSKGHDLSDLLKPRKFRND